MAKSNRIANTDLIDIDGFISAIERLEKANLKFGDTAAKANERVRQSMVGLKEEADSLKVKIGESLSRGKSTSPLQGEVEANTRAFRNLDAAIKANQQVLDLNTASVDALKTRLKTLKTEYDSLDRSEAKNVARMKEIAQETKAATVVVNGLALATSRAAKAQEAAEGSYDALSQQLNRMRAELKAMPHAFDATTGAINKQNKAALELQKRIEETAEVVQRADKDMLQFGRNVGNYPQAFGQVTALLGTIGGLGAVTAGLTAVATTVFEVGTEYEKLDLLLQSAYAGNEKAAARAQATVRAFADASPHEIDQVTAAFTRLVDVGVDPTAEQLTQISDVAVSKSKSMLDYVEAIADAQQGEFERLKEFGINASKDGDKVRFIFKGVTTEVAASQSAITDYLIGLGKVPGVMGVTEKLAASTTGKLSTMNDTWKSVADSIFRYVQPALNKFIDLSTGAGNAIKSFFASASDVSGQAFAEQTRKVNELESTLPKLISRYDELKSKSQLTTAEQKELQGVTNQLAQLVPSAASGFDAYGNALDVNKSKVLSFAAAQRELNAELNKQANADLQKQIDKNLRSIDNLRKGMNQKVVSTDRRGENATERDLTDAERRNYQTTINDLSQQTLTATKQIITNGGQLSAAARKYIQASGDLSAKQLLLVDDYSQKIAQKNAQAATLFNQGKFKERAALVKEIEKLKTDLNQILNPSSGPAVKVPDTPLSGGKKTNEQKNALETLLEAQRKIEDQLINMAVAAQKAGQELTLDPKAVALLKQYNDIQNQILETERQRGRLAYSQSVTGNLDVDTIKRRESAGPDGSGIALTPDRIAARMENDLKVAQDFAKLEYLNFVQLSDLKTEYETRAANARTEHERKTADERVKIIANELQERGKLYDQDAEKAREVEEQKRDLLIEIGRTAVEGLFDIGNQRIDNQLSQLGKQKEAELALVGNNAAAREAIEKRFDEKQKQLKRQQAIRDKAEAIFQIAINTAVAVSKATTTGPLGAAIIPLTIALGAAQAAAVAARPIPAFKDGKNVDSLDRYEGPALVGEAGRELWIHDRKAELVDRPSILNVGKKDMIFPNKATETLLANPDFGYAARVRNTTVMSEIARANIDRGKEAQQARVMVYSGLTADAIGKAVAREMSKLPQRGGVIDENRLYQTFEERRKRKEYIEKRNRLKG